MSRLPLWVAAATDTDPHEVSRLLDGAQEGAALVREATEPMPEEISSLLRRRLSAAEPEPWPLVLRALARSRPLLLALSLIVLLGLALPWLAAADRVSLAPEPLASYAATGSGSYTQLQRGREGLLIEQIEGVVRYHVDPLPEGQRFRVRAREVEVEVVGTVFDVGIESDRVWVFVLEGGVRVSTPSAQLLLARGERWEGESPASPLLGTRAPIERPIAPPIALSPALPEQVEPAPSAQAEPIEQKPHKASRTESYASLLGRIDSGERSEALVSALEAFAAESDGPLSDAALVTAIDVAASVRPPEAVLATIDWFLTTRPRTAHRKALLELRGDLARDRMRNCEIALPSYRELAGTATGSQQARAEALRGLCAASVGRVDEAKTALVASLQLGIDLPLRSEVHAALDALE